MNKSHSESVTAWEVPDISANLALVVAEPKLSREEQIFNIAKEELYAENFSAGHAEGVAKGREEGEQLAQTESREALKPVEELVEALKNPLENQLSQDVINSIALLVTKVSQQVIQGELTAKPERISDVVNDLFTHLPMTEREVRLRMHPDDMHIIERGEGVASTTINWSVEGDASITRGGCLVESHTFSVDATVESRIEHSLQNVFGKSYKVDQDITKIDQESTVEEELGGDVNSSDSDLTNAIDSSS
ncbi:MAG: hypothetical protein HOE55_02275 [Thiotrichales bacterium]|jgi:flagellar assembly protein FliH|nr:hypothetical protein [Thiotrichales bacterium]MBT4151862.1 hypothetical protein [Thiotrichales bacterium]MBT4261989.1 hypothetical protein [Thiotrichales bacterium]MBT7315292.1 hypothetical protein [Thiotrichales bacterium]